jgi:exodeoxyribonuclease V alpha subunit
MIEQLEATGLFRSLDLHFARFLVSLTAETSRGLILASALVSRAVGQGNVCLDLREYAGKSLIEVEPDPMPSSDPPQQKQREIRCPRFDRWLAELQGSSAVGKPGEIRPLVLDARGRLYLQRYWSYESTLASRISELAAEEIKDVDLRKLERDLDRLFPQNAKGEADYQKLAALTAALRRFCVISGGPGTGKTWVVSKILEVLAEQNLRASPRRGLTVALTAPTGKAAARLAAAVGRNLPVSLLERTAMRWEGGTIHRLLGRLAAGKGYHLDVLIVDEASMADLGLMARLMEAVPEEARIIWLGDKDQLSSVEAGAVLGDVCAGSDSRSTDFEIKATRLTGRRPGERQGHQGRAQKHASDKSTAQSTLRDCIVLLEKSYRFGAKSTIASVSRAINRGLADRTVQLMRRAPQSEFQWLEPDEYSPSSRWPRSLVSRIVKGFGDYAQARSPEEAFERLAQFRVLCALRRGPFGVEAINRAIEGWLEHEGLINTYQRWYRGRPVLITRNDYRTGLFNGDVGIVLPAPGVESSQAVFFQDIEGGIKAIRPSMLPEHETVYAMTVHKSQGSEFEEVLLLLPQSHTRVMTRELLYTGITRAIRRIEVWGSETVIREAIASPIERSSGLRDALWETPHSRSAQTMP